MFFCGTGGDQVMVVMSHVGIEPDLLKKGLRKKDTDQGIKLIRKKHGNRCTRETVFLR